ncbi:hypothetical protein [Streptomyces sp.]|uniref:hypothetical protein n=1 Tax=Streptomyces sp. TaxID=1931 RepID=UPI0028128328|nr:hypothetical protein [Streptomyces sp.]
MTTYTTSTRPARVRRRRSVRAGLLAATAVAALTLSACGDDGDGDAASAPSTTGAPSRPAVCEDLASLKGHASELSRLGPSSSYADIEDLREDMNGDMDDIRESAKETGGAAVDTGRLDRVYGTFNKTVDALDDDRMSGEGRLNQLRPQLAEVTKAVTDSERAASC